jgi:hypothetical protein
LNSFSKNVKKSFSRPPTAEIRPPEVPEITLKKKQHGSARHVKLSHDISASRGENKMKSTQPSTRVLLWLALQQKQ